MARHCGYCYKTGHNRRTCPQRIEALNNRIGLLKEGIETETLPLRRESLEAQLRHCASLVAEMTGVNPITGEKKNRRPNVVRKCSYCRAPGHTRRTCETLRVDKNIYRAATISTRAALLENMKETGIGIGTMFVKPVGRYNEDGSWIKLPTAFIVTEIGFDSYTYGSHCIRMLARRVASLNNGNSYRAYNDVTDVTFTSLKDWMGRSSESGYMVSPAGATSAPIGWLGGCNIEYSQTGFFADAQLRDYRMRELDHECDRDRAPAALQEAWKSVVGESR